MQDKQDSQATLARALVRSTDSGILSTMSTELPGYPFGSVTPYVMTFEGNIVVYVSDIAQHTANMDADEKACLTVIQKTDGNQQEFGRVTVIGDASRVPEDRVEAVAERYFQFFPEAKTYGQAHGFDFYWVVPVRVRYIGGFGKIFWIEQDQWGFEAPDWAAQEDYIRTHMNENHSDSLIAMARHYCGVEAQAVELVAIDVEGCHIRADGKIHYMAYEAPCLTMDEVRGAMVKMARTAA